MLVDTTDPKVHHPARVPVPLIRPTAKNRTGEQLPTIDNQVLDFSELLIDRAESGPTVVAKVGQLCLDCRETQCMLSLIGSQRVDRGQNRTVLSLGCFERRDTRFQLFQSGYRTVLLAVHRNGHGDHRDDRDARASAGQDLAAAARSTHPRDRLRRPSPTACTDR